MKIEYNENMNNELLERLEYVEIINTIPQVFIEYRERFEMLQEDLANLLGIKQAMVSRIESGRYNPSIKTLYHFCRKMQNENYCPYSEILIKMLDISDRNYNDIYKLNLKFDIKNNKDEYEYEIKNNINVFKLDNINLKLKATDKICIRA